MPVDKEVISKYIKAHLNFLEENNFDEFLDTPRIYGFSEEFSVTFENFRDSLLEILDTSGIDYMSRMKHIPTRLFANNTNLVSIEIPSNIKGIGAKAFKECSQLQSVTISEGVEIIGLKAFNFCESLTSVKLPESLYRLGEMAFAGCRNLKNITLPKLHLMHLPDAVFLGTDISDIEIPDNVGFIDHRAFAECNNLTRISIGDKIAGESDIFLQSNNIQVINYRGTWESLKRNALFKKFVRNDLPARVEISCTDRKLTFTQFLAATGKVS